MQERTPVTAAPKDEPQADRGGVHSVEIAATLLKVLAAEGGTLPLGRLAAAAGMPRAKVHRYLVSLRRTGLIAQDAETGQYRIGVAAVTVGLVGLRSQGPIRQVSDALPRLRDRVNETVTMAIWGPTGPIVTAMEESDHVVTMNVRTGSVLPLTTTAIGQVFAAYLPANATRGLIAAERRRAGAGLPSPAAFEATLAEVRRRRIARADSALLPGVDALAAPVLDHQGKLVAAICVIGRRETLDAALDGPVARALFDTAADLSRQLGYLDG